MTLKVGEKADALYLRLDDSKIIESEEVPSSVIFRCRQSSCCSRDSGSFPSVLLSWTCINYNFRAINPNQNGCAAAWGLASKTAADHYLAYLFLAQAKKSTRGARSLRRSS
jgi:hypothetical protein